MKTHSALFVGRWSGGGVGELGGAKNLGTLLFQSTIDIHIRNARKIATKLRRLARTQCVYWKTGHSEHIFYLFFKLPLYCNTLVAYTRRYRSGVPSTGTDREYRVQAVHNRINMFKNYFIPRAMWGPSVSILVKQEPNYQKPMINLSKTLVYNFLYKNMLKFYSSLL